jgi:hypothetical protein
MTRRNFMAAALAGSAREESIKRVMERMLTGLEFVLLQVGRRTVLAETWINARTAAPLGSLVKPFFALAYGSANAFRYPQFVCAPGGCWLPSGHGKVTIQDAIAQSCNAYFERLASGTPIAAIERICTRYGLPAPYDVAPDSLIGRQGRWTATPLSVARAYAELIARQSEPGVSNIIAGLRLCAQIGTAAAAGVRMAAKTGTAPCSHDVRAPGDGLLAASFPEQVPEFVLIARGHGIPGAEVARKCGPCLRAVTGG